MIMVGCSVCAATLLSSCLLPPRCAVVLLPVHWKVVEDSVNFQWMEPDLKSARVRALRACAKKQKRERITRRNGIVLDAVVLKYCTILLQ